MIVGHQKLENDFKRLIKNGRLGHGYIFFGEEKIGKRFFALSLANYLENGKFEKPIHLLKDCLLIEPESGTIGIDAIRRLKECLGRRPLISARMAVIINDADTLTPQAENALLKITEDSPAAALIILVVKNPEVLLTTLSSRFQKIYFSRIKNKEIKEFLKRHCQIEDLIAEKIAHQSFGQLGRALNILKKESSLANELLKSATNRRQFIKELVKKEDFNFERFLEDLIGLLSVDIKKNYNLIKKALLLRQAAVYNLNPRLQLESLFQ